MKLLFDENLAPRLSLDLADVFPASTHVRDVGLARADDAAIWEYAGRCELAIVTKDDDFRQRSFLFGPPPKVVWVRLGNCNTVDLARILRVRAADILKFELDLNQAIPVARKCPS